MHDLMFEEQNKLTVAELKEKAARLKLNRSRFDGCMDTGRFTEQVQEDTKEGARVGVGGTPALFVNGVSIDGGAVSYETVVKAIDKELARLKR
jgi:protein-disulfide isomerase